MSIVDGDTIKVMVGDTKETIRIIGVDTPETKKPHVPVQCFGKEATSRMQSLVQSRSVQLEADSSQADRDKYGRLLRHVFVGGDTNVALAMIADGYGREYTYDGPYHYRLQYLAAMNQAKTAKRGTWGPPCNGFHKDDPAASSGSGASSSSSASAAASSEPAAASVAGPSATSAAATGAQGSSAGGGSGNCTIKGNINSKGEKIAHKPGQSAYEKTKVTESKGERWFCSEAEAIAAGWRMARA